MPRNFFMSEIHRLAASRFLKYYHFRANQRTKIFAVWAANHDVAYNEERPVRVSVTKPDIGFFYFNASHPISIGTMGGLRPHLERFSPPLELPLGSHVWFMLSGEPNQWLQCGYEADIGLEYMGQGDLTYNQPTTRTRAIIDAVTDGAAYVDSELIQLLNYDELMFGVTCVDADADFQILASLDGTTYDIVLAGPDVITDGAATEVYRLTEYYPYIKAQSKDNSGGAPWSVTTAILAVKMP